MNVKEATELIELSFEYVTGEYNDCSKIFRKRKISYLGSGSVPGASWSSMDCDPSGDMSLKSTFLVIIIFVFDCLFQIYKIAVNTVRCRTRTSYMTHELTTL